MNTTIRLNQNLETLAPSAYQADTRRSQPTDTDAKNAALVVQPEYVSVSGTLELLKLMLESAKVDKSAKKELQRSSEAAETEAESAQVDALREKANHSFGSSLLSAAGSFASSMATAAAGSVQLGVPDEKVGASIGKVIEGAGKTQEATASVASSVERLQSDRDGVKATELEARANALRRSADSLKSDIDDVKQHDRKLLDFVREIEASMNRCTQIALQSR